MVIIMFAPLLGFVALVVAAILFMGSMAQIEIPDESPVLPEP